MYAIGTQLRFAGLALYADHVVDLGGHHVLPDDYRLAGVAAAYWHPLLLVMLWLTWLRLDHQRRQRRWLSARTCCIRCGYDLRASTGRCPECGTAMPLSDKAGGLGNAGEDRADSRGAGGAGGGGRKWGSAQ